MDVNVNKTDGEQEVKTYTQEEVMELLQKEADKRVTEALKKQEKKYQKEMAKQKSLVGLDEEARAKAEKEQRIADLEEQLMKYKLANTKSEIAKVLNNRGLDANLVEFVVTSDDTDECLAKIEQLDKIVKKMVKAEVEKKLPNYATTPKMSVQSEGMTKEQFNKLSLAEQSELLKTNKELVMNLLEK